MTSAAFHDFSFSRCCCFLVGGSEGILGKLILIYWIILFAMTDWYADTHYHIYGWPIGGSWVLWGGGGIYWLLAIAELMRD